MSRFWQPRTASILTSTRLCGDSRGSSVNARSPGGWKPNTGPRFEGDVDPRPFLVRKQRSGACSRRVRQRMGKDTIISPARHQLPLPFGCTWGLDGTATSWTCCWIGITWCILPIIVTAGAGKAAGAATKLARHARTATSVNARTGSGYGPGPTPLTQHHTHALTHPQLSSGERTGFPPPCRTPITPQRDSSQTWRYLT